MPRNRNHFCSTPQGAVGAVVRKLEGKEEEEKWKWKDSDMSSNSKADTTFARAASASITRLRSGAVAVNVSLGYYRILFHRKGRSGSR